MTEYNDPLTGTVKEKYTNFKNLILEINLLNVILLVDINHNLLNQIQVLIMGLMLNPIKKELLVMVLKINIIIIYQK